MEQVRVNSQNFARAEARWIADMIEDLVGKRGLKHSDIGVLARSVSTAAPPLVNEFKIRRIPYIVGGARE